MRDALLVAVEHREEAGARAEQPARAVAVDRLDLDHFGAHVGEHHAARRAHDHVRELDDAQAGRGAAARTSSSGSLAVDAARRGAASSSASPARHSVPCSVSPSSHARPRAQRDQRGRSRGRSRCPCWRTCRPRLRSRRCRSRRAHAGSRRCRPGRHRSGVTPSLPARRTRWPGRGRACRGSGRSQSGRRRSRSACSNSSLHLQRIGVADRVGEADAIGAGVEHRLHQAQHFGWLDAALDRAAERGADADLDQRARAARHRARARMRAISATTSSGVLRRLARLCAWLADSGTSIRSALASIARSAPLRLGTSTDDEQAGQRLGEAPALRRCRPAAAAAAAGTNEPTSISRCPAACASRIHSIFCAVGRMRCDALQAVAQADLAHDDGIGCGEHGASLPSLPSHLRCRAQRPVPDQRLSQAACNGAKSSLIVIGIASATHWSSEATSARALVAAA